MENGNALQRIRETIGMELHLAATDPIEPIHDYNIPILPFKHPPAKEDLRKIRRQRKKHEPDSGTIDSNTPNGDGHVDDYA